MTSVATHAVPRLLVVDDDPDIGALVGAIAGQAGFTVSTAQSLEQFRRERSGRDADVIVLDLILPDVDGIEIIRLLAAQESAAGLVLISGLDQRVLDAAERLAAAQGLHVIGSLAKPFDRRTMRRLLDEFTPADGATEQSGPPSITVSDLRRGMAQGEFKVYFQPKIELQTLEFVAAEALVRWRHPSLGVIPPSAFIELAERTGMIGHLTESVMERAFAECGRWHDAGLRLKVAVNLSARSLNSLDLPESVVALAADEGLRPNQIIIEITESWLGNDEVTALDILTRLRMKGFQLSIDDFGTGYATMLQLKQIPFSELKLGQSFIRGAATDAEARVIVETSIDLGRRLGLQVVAEGIERQEDWDLISDLGCDLGQGYFIARPMSGRVLPHWLRRWNTALGHGD